MIRFSDSYSIADACDCGRAVDVTLHGEWCGALLFDGEGWTASGALLDLFPWLRNYTWIDLRDAKRAVLLAWTRPGRLTALKITMATWRDPHFETDGSVATRPEAWSAHAHTAYMIQKRADHLKWALGWVASMLRPNPHYYGILDFAKVRENVAYHMKRPT